MTGSRVTEKKTELMELCVTETRQRPSLLVYGHNEIEKERNEKSAKMLLTLE